MHWFSYIAFVEQQRNWFNWTLALAIALGARLAASLLLRSLPATGQEPPTTLARALVDTLRQQTHPIAIWCLGLWLASPYMHLPENWLLPLSNMLWLVSLWQIGRWLNHLLQTFVHHLWQPETSVTDAGWRTTRQFVATIASGVVWFFVLSMGLDKLDIHMWPLLTTFGLTGAILVLATQNIASDLLASFSLLLDRPFVVGDFIRFDQYTGRVERIGLKTTRLRSVQGEELCIGNSDLLRQKIANVTRSKERRYVHAFPLTWQTPVANLQRLPEMIANEMKDQAELRFERASCSTQDDGQLTLEVIYYALGDDSSKYPQVQHKVLLKLLRIFHRENIPIQAVQRLNTTTGSSK